MDEFELIRHYFTREPRHPALRLGVGDDCAIVDIPAECELVFSMDSLVAGRHFFVEGAAYDIGQRALRVCLSDLAAMGAEPLYFTLALSIPEKDDRWLKGFSQGMFQVADQYGCELVGGDTVKGPLLITIQVHGCVPKGKAVVRSGARCGDLIVVSGTLGDAAAALPVLSGNKALPEEAYAYFKQAYYQPQPRFDIGGFIRDFATAAIDISDGFLADLGHICVASGVAAKVNLDTLPISSALSAHFSEEESLAYALAGGDDYQLCLCIAQEHREALLAQIEGEQLDMTIIGEIVDGEGVQYSEERGIDAQVPNGKVQCYRNGKPYTPRVLGYKHF